MKTATRITLIIVATIAIACSNQQNKIEVQIPESLQHNEAALNHINEMTISVEQFNTSVSKLAKLTRGKDLDNTDSLSARQIFVLGKEGLKFMRAGKKIEELEKQRPFIISKLNETNKAAFENICAELQSKLGAIDFESLGLSDADAAVFEEKIKAQQTYQAKEKAYSDSIQELRNDAISNLPPEEQAKYQNDNNVKKDLTNKDRMKIFAGFAFAFLLILAAIIFTIKRVIKIIKNIR